MELELAAVVLTRDEERNVEECLRSVAWADLRVVFDAFSTDRTVELAAACGASVVQREFSDFADQRNAALEAIEASWILFVDADERATPLLADEVRHVIRDSAGRIRAGWWVPRHNLMLGHRMRGGGWYPDYQLRLLRRGHARYDPSRPVHEIVVLDGESGYLNNVLIHHNYESVAQFRKKMLGYTTLEASILHERRVHVHPWTYVSMPLREFWRRFVILKGYQDHVYGVLFCALMGWYVFLTYLRLRELRQSAEA